MPSTNDTAERSDTPNPGEWPVDPQEAENTIREDRIFVDGCFDCFHHGHAGMILKCLELGRQIYVGLHSDEDIATMLSKGRTIMTLEERSIAIAASRFVTKCVPSAPMVAKISWLDHYGCGYAAHGDEDSSTKWGEDGYWRIKEQGRMKYVPRTEGISTTDLVGRMLWLTTKHHIPSLGTTLSKDNDGEVDGKIGMRRNIQRYAAAPDGKPLVQVYNYTCQHWASCTTPYDGANCIRVNDMESTQPSLRHEQCVEHFEVISYGNHPRPGQRVVYADGSFDLFSPAHITFLESVVASERRHGELSGWYTEAAQLQRIRDSGFDYEPAYVIVGVLDDTTVNRNKGGNYPIMNIYERGLCVIQCRYVNAVILSAPTTPSRSYITNITCLQGRKYTSLDAEYHQDMRMFDPDEPCRLHDVDTEQIVQRIFERKADFELRQQKKGAIADPSFQQ